MMIVIIHKTEKPSSRTRQISNFLAQDIELILSV